MSELVDPQTAADPTAAWTGLISRNDDDGCGAIDVELEPEDEKRPRRWA